MYCFRDSQDLISYDVLSIYHGENYLTNSYNFTACDQECAGMQIANQYKMNSCNEILMRS